MNPDLFKNYAAGAAIAAYRIVKLSADDTVVQAAASTDALMGVVQQLGADAQGDRVDVAFGGIVEIEFGGNVTRGDPVTADADGKAVAAAPGAGVNARIIGFATVSGVAGDIGRVRYAPGVMQGA